MVQRLHGRYARLDPAAETVRCVMIVRILILVGCGVAAGLLVAFGAAAVVVATCPLLLTAGTVAGAGISTHS